MAEVERLVHMDAFEWNGFYMPPEGLDALKRYVFEGIPTGGFLRAVLENNLEGAVSRADEYNLRNIPVYGFVLFNYCPMTCWGSKEMVDSWIKHRGLKGE